MKEFSYCLLLALFASSPALADQVLEKKTKVLGKEFSVKEQLGSVPTGNGVDALTQVKFFGKAIQLLSSKVDYAVVDGKIANNANDLYVNGMKVYTGAGTFQNGTLSYAGSVPPTQIDMPVFSYTIGPVVLELKAGVDFEAGVDAKLSSPLLAADLSGVLTADSLMNASLVTKATASGYIEGLARVLIFQVGAGGNVNIIDGNATVAAVIPVLDPTHPTLTYDGKLHVLSGRLYAFVDYRMLGSWKRLKDLNLYSWNGLCWSMGGQSCTALN